MKIEYPMLEKQWRNHHATLLCDSFLHWTKRPLLSDSITQNYAAEDKHYDNPQSSLFEQLFEAPFALFSHGNEDDPVFNFSNRVGLTLFEYQWNDFVQLPSRLSAEPVNRAERAKLLASVEKYGHITDYRGVRISASGKRFSIDDAIIWNLLDNSGSYCGQAAAIYQWHSLQATQ